MPKIETRDVAARLRVLLGSRTVDEAAMLLDVSDLALRRSIDPDAPQPTIEVVIAAARFFAVDPTWILIGEYDASTHRVVLDGEVERVTRVVQQLLATPSGDMPGQTPGAS